MAVHNHVFAWAVCLGMAVVVGLLFPSLFIIMDISSNGSGTGADASDEDSFGGGGDNIGSGGTSTTTGGGNGGAGSTFNASCVGECCENPVCNVTCPDFDFDVRLPTITEPEDPMPGCLDMTGRIVVVIGAAQGLGLTAMQEFEQQGAVVFGCDAAAAVNDVWNDLSGPQSWIYSQCDTSSEVSMQNFVDSVLAHASNTLNRVDVVWYYASVAGFGRPYNIPEADVERTLEQMNYGVARADRLLYPHMLHANTRFMVYNAITSGFPLSSNGIYPALNRALTWDALIHTGSHNAQMPSDAVPNENAPVYISMHAAFTRVLKANIQDGDPLLEDALVNATKCVSGASLSAYFSAVLAARQVFLAACDPDPPYVYHILGNVTEAGDIEAGETTFNIYALQALALLSDSRLTTEVNRSFLSVLLDAYQAILDAVPPANQQTYQDCCVCLQTDVTNAKCSAFDSTPCGALFGSPPYAV